MEIIILQGENEVAIEERLFRFISEAKRRNWSIVNINEKGEVLDKLLLVDLYAPKSLFVVGNYQFLSKKDIKFIKEKAKKIDSVLIICSKGVKVPNSVLKELPDIKKIENFEYPKLIFDFLDSLYPSGARRAISLFQQLVREEAVEFIFHMVFLRIRDLYWVRTDPSTIPYPSWRVERLERQASKFRKNELKNFIEDLASIDVEAKRSSLGIAYYLDLLIVKYLK